MLIIRVWQEDEAFRASVSHTTDVLSGEPTQHASAGTPAQVLTLVEQWLRSI
jgi:hypothetical protein